MKKIFSILMSVLILGTSAIAQDKVGAKQPKVKANMAASQQKAPDNAGAANSNGTSVTKTKKDGTPDMRHKANKDAAKPAQKLKKDGTPDMRYSENKEAAKKK